MAPTAESVSDPSSPDYNRRSPLYDPTADSSSKYYVGPLKTDDTPSGDEIRAMATQQIDDEIRRLRLGPAVDPVLRDQKIQELYQQHLDNSKNGLDEGLSMRETGEPPHMLWSNASHEQMNDAITLDANPATVAETSEEWVQVGNDLGTHQKNLADSITASTSNWQGDAGDAVREHLAGVGKWLGATAQGATLMRPPAGDPLPGAQRDAAADGREPAGAVRPAGHQPEAAVDDRPGAVRVGGR